MPGDIDSDWDVEMFKLFDMKCRVRIEDFQLRLLLTIILFFFLEKKTVNGGYSSIRLIGNFQLHIYIFHI